MAEYSPLSIKSAVVGYGRAEKHQVQQMVTRLLNLAAPPEPTDASDALAIAICHIHTAATNSRYAGGDAMKRDAAVILFVLALLAGRVDAAGAEAGPELGTPIVRTPSHFDRVWEAYTPQSVTITVQPTGAAKYHSRNPLQDAGRRTRTRITRSTSPCPPANRDKLFRYAKEANYFNGDFTFKKHAVSSTGKKTLTYTDPARHFDTSVRLLREQSHPGDYQHLSGNLQHH